MSSSSTVIKPFTQRARQKAIKPLNINDFKLDIESLWQNNAQGNHRIRRGKLAGNEHLWYCKDMESRDVAYEEILAQEFFRLILPRQPQTYLAVDPDTKVFYILSQQIPNFTPLPHGRQDDFRKGFFKGLGQVSFLAHFIQEIDFKNGNVGCDNEGNVFKVDGDCCFVEFDRNVDRKDFLITKNSIKQLPAPNGFYAYNWLDYIQAEQSNQQSKILPADIAEYAFIRQEIHQAMLSVALIPPQFLSDLVDSYFPYGEQRYLNLLLDRQQQLIAHLQQNKPFQLFLQSAKAQQVIMDIKQQMLSMLAQGSMWIATEETAKNIDELTLHQLQLCANKEQNRSNIDSLTNQLPHNLSFWQPFIPTSQYQQTQQKGISK